MRAKEKARSGFFASATKRLPTVPVHRRSRFNARLSPRATIHTHLQYSRNQTEATPTLSGTEQKEYLPYQRTPKTRSTGQSVVCHPLSFRFRREAKERFTQLHLRRVSRRDGIVPWKPQKVGKEFLEKYDEKRQQARTFVHGKRATAVQHVEKWKYQHWLSGRGQQEQQRRKRAHMKRLRAWWEFLDSDGGGSLSVDELEDPLVSVGLAKGRAEVIRLINAHDTSGTGELNWRSFVNMLTVNHNHNHNQIERNTNSLHNTGEVNDKEAVQPEENAVVQLFRALEEGRIGNTQLAVPLQITAYRRQMLLDANTAKNSVARQKGLMVLRGIRTTKLLDLR